MLLTVSRVAKILDTSEGTVRAMEGRGELPAIRTSTGIRLFDQTVVEQLARDRAKQRAAAAAATTAA